MPLLCLKGIELVIVVMKTRSSKYKVVGYQVMNCPICQHVHTIELREVVAETKFKGKVLQYMEQYCYCENVAGRFSEYMTKEQLQINQKRLDEAYEQNRGIVLDEAETQSHDI